MIDRHRFILEALEDGYAIYDRKARRSHAARGAAAAAIAALEEGVATIAELRARITGPGALDESAALAADEAISALVQIGLLEPND